MDYAEFRCRGCRKLHRQRVVDQHYCGATGCQRARRNAWRRERYATDLDYRLTARSATAAWLREQGGAARYYRAYRHKQRKKPRDGAARMRRGPASTSRLPGRAALGAKSDAKTAQPTVTIGQYLLVPSGAKSDAIFVELRAITGDLAALQRTTTYETAKIAGRLGP